jgi:hypothetical protein
MKLNKECIRDVLLYIEEHCIFENDKRFGRMLHQVSLNELLKAEQTSKYSYDDLHYTLEKMFEGRYIDGHYIPNNAPHTFNIARVDALTLRGHDLLDNIRPEPVWNETKSVLQKVGDFSLGILSQVAGEIMAVYTKKMMGLE